MIEELNLYPETIAVQKTPHSFVKRVLLIFTRSGTRSDQFWTTFCPWANLPAAVFLSEWPWGTDWTATDQSGIILFSQLFYAVHVTAGDLNEDAPISLHYKSETPAQWELFFSTSLMNSPPKPANRIATRLQEQSWHGHNLLYFVVRYFWSKNCEPGAVNVGRTIV